MSTEGSLTTIGGHGHTETSETVETLFSIKLHRRKYFQGMAFSLADIPPEHCARFGGSHRHLFVEIDKILINWSPGWIGQALYSISISFATMTALSRYSHLFSSSSSAIAYLAIVWNLIWMLVLEKQECSLISFGKIHLLKTRVAARLLNQDVVESSDASLSDPKLTLRLW